MTTAEVREAPAVSGGALWGHWRVTRAVFTMHIGDAPSVSEDTELAGIKEFDIDGVDRFRVDRKPEPHRYKLLKGGKVLLLEHAAIAVDQFAVRIQGDTMEWAGSKLDEDGQPVVDIYVSLQRFDPKTAAEPEGVMVDFGVQWRLMSPSPSFPAEAEGLPNAVCMATIGLDVVGNVSGVHVADCAQPFHNEVRSALEQWIAWPHKVDGKAVPFRTKVKVHVRKDTRPDP